MLIRSLFFILLFSFTLSLWAQEQSRESMAVDATAAQWSYQFAYEGFFDYDTTDGRPEGNKGFFRSAPDRSGSRGR